MNKNLKKKTTTLLLTLALLTSAVNAVFADDCGLEDEELLTCINTCVDEDEDEENSVNCEHSYRSSVTKPTCRSIGYTTYRCELCGDCYTDEYVDFMCDYNGWVSAGENSFRHLQVCSYCGHASGESAECELIYVQFADTVYGICAACGTFGNNTMELAEDAICQIGGVELSGEEVIVREMEEPFWEGYGELSGYTDSQVLADRIFTVTMNNEAGALESPEEEMTVTVRCDRRYGWGRLKLVQLLDDGTWEEIDAEYSWEDDTLTFNTTKAGVFMIVY